MSHITRCRQFTTSNSLFFLSLSYIILNCEYISVILIFMISILKNGSDVKICIVMFIYHVLASFFNILIPIKLTVLYKDI